MFDRFRKANLKLKAAKCKLFQEQCKFVGHIVSGRGIEVDPAKIACIVNWPFPRTISELRGFLGLCSYYRSFCPGFATVADPLTECLRKGVTLCHTPERQAAFDKLKQMLTSTPVLAMPRDDPDCTYVIDSDASGTGGSAILQQWQDGKLRVIEYASRTFNASERAYCATRREMAALIFGLKQFRPYLLGRRFQIRVDNMALTYYRNMKDATGQAARYLDFLSLFDFEPVYRSGSRHVNADSVSRLRPCELDGGEPCKQCNRRVTGQHCVNAVNTRAKNKWARLAVGRDDVKWTLTDSPILDSDGRAGKRRRRRRSRPASTFLATAPTAWETADKWSTTELHNAQLRDNDIAPAVAWVENCIRPPWAEMQAGTFTHDTSTVATV